MCARCQDAQVACIGDHLRSYNSGLQSLCLLQVEGATRGQVLHEPEDALAAVAAAEVRRRAVEVGGLQGLRWRAAVGWNAGFEANTSIAQCRECAEGLWCFVGGRFAQAYS
jgi:hypothetical protein